MQNRQNSWSPPVFARKHASSMQASSTTLENIVVIMRQVVEAPAGSSIQLRKLKTEARPRRTWWWLLEDSLQHESEIHWGGQ